MTAVTTAKRSGGRTLDTARDAEIRRAALDLLVEQGYDRLTVEAVAARAQAGKATIYRRWASKAELVLDAVNQLKGPVGPLPDTGTLAGDLRAYFANVATPGDSPFPLICGLATALPRDPDLARVFGESFMAPRQAELRTLLQRGVERGEVPRGREFDLLVTLFPALMLYRVVLRGEQPDPAYVAAIVDEVILPLATSTPNRRGGGRK
jgi:AcrR family transcriptional regulator